MKWLWPIVTGRTFFDTSSIIHLAFWTFVGSGTAYARWAFWKALLLGLVLAYGWEIVEKWYFEPTYPGLWRHPELFLNRWVSDPLMCVAGILIAYWLVELQ